MLYETLDAKLALDGERYFIDLAKSQVQVLSNLNQRFQFRDYQLQAFGRLKFYCEGYARRGSPVHLLFNMATGSGKTNLMGAAILYFYQHGYRNFLFFTRLGQIVEKTKLNFLDNTSAKYVFGESILIDNKRVKINFVDNFNASRSDDINIIFSTTSGIHSQLTSPRENSLSLEDIGNYKMVMLADEAHNLSSDTQAMTSAEEDLGVSWESIVNQVLVSNLNKENVLLEFTATARLDSGNPEVLEKYRDKAIYKYSLKEFRLDGYSKEVRILQVDAPLMVRVLSAVVISQYRMKVAEKHGIYLKPIILFKANRVNSKSGQKSNFLDEDVIFSNEFKAKFHEFIGNLKVSDIANLKTIDDKYLKRAFRFFKDAGVTLEHLVTELKSDFMKEKCLTVDDDRDASEKQFALNDLENPRNPIRAVFATESLNEGWDVLNLFDIVRLYNSRDSKGNKAGRTTVQEAQLIGRGARYFPFTTPGHQDPFRRKFDDDAASELDILETLVYHSRTNSRYIQELRNVLVQQGLVPANVVYRKIEVKPSIKRSKIWTNGLVFQNFQESNEGSKVLSLADARVTFNSFDEKNIYVLPTYYSSDTRIFKEETESGGDSNLDSITINLSDLGPSLIRTALWRGKYGKFSVLKSVFGGLVSSEEFISSPDYLGGISVTIRGRRHQIENLTTEELLDVSTFAINRIMSEAFTEKYEYRGSRHFVPRSLESVFGQSKELKLDLESPRSKPISERFPNFDLEKADWFAQNEVWGTDQEEKFVFFLSTFMDQIEKKYSDVLLLRNEHHLSIFNFADGEAFYPDFILLARSSGDEEIKYQVFIEPKGGHLRELDAWKEEFLEAISKNGVAKIVGEKFRLVGLPFFTESEADDDALDRFRAAFEDFVN